MTHLTDRHILTQFFLTTHFFHSQIVLILDQVKELLESVYTTKIVTHHCWFVIKGALRLSPPPPPPTLLPSSTYC
jgi:hypothetical protein